jgi:glutathione S-transferase
MTVPVLYFAPNACSLATHIALREAGLDFLPVRVDLATRRTEHGEDFAAIHAKGYVPALVLEDGELLSESSALLDWIAQRATALRPADERARTRQLSLLCFLSTQLHKPFVSLFFEEDHARRAALAGELNGRFDGLAVSLDAHAHVLGTAYSVGDALLYVMERWAALLDLTLPPVLHAHALRVEARPAVRAALAQEGLEPVFVR